MRSCNPPGAISCPPIADLGFGLASDIVEDCERLAKGGSFFNKLVSVGRLARSVFGENIPGALDEVRDRCGAWLLRNLNPDAIAEAEAVGFYEVDCLHEMLSDSLDGRSNKLHVAAIVRRHDDLMSLIWSLRACGQGKGVGKAELALLESFPDIYMSTNNGERE